MGKKILDYFIKTLNGMAYGLFSTLIIGTIISTIASFFHDDFVNPILNDLATGLKMLTGVGIGLGIAASLKLDGLKLIGATVAGGLASYLSGTIEFKIGDPLVIYFVVIISVELTNLVLRKKTPVDIIIIPLFISIIASITTLLINKPVSNVTTAIGNFITRTTELHPFVMGIIISVVMGMALTAPISSAAIAIAINLSGLAAGAAVVGCSVQMVGFAVMSRKDNNLGTIISIGIGTSMLQFKNIVKKPIIWLPTIIVSAILGPLATVVFKVLCNKYGAGMGTSGLVGQIQTFAEMKNTPMTWFSIIGLQIIIPMILVYIIDVIFRKYHLIENGDLKV
ncbi:MAG TPA: PTS sugar transporter subunit IIC [Bacilli bacterium]